MEVVKETAESDSEDDTAKTFHRPILWTLGIFRFVVLV